MTEKELLKLKEQLDTAKTQLAELKGQEKTLLQRLADEFDCKTLAEAKTKVQEFENSLKEITDEIEEKTKQFENTYAQYFE